MLKDNMLEESIRTIENNLAAHGKTLPVDSNLLLLCSEMDSFAVDYQKLKHLGNLEFFQAMYICLFKRFPDKMAYDNSKESISNLDQETFQKIMIPPLISSYECRVKATYVVNCPWLVEGNSNPKYLTRGERIYQKYHTRYMKLPRWMRKVLKKLLKKRMLGSV